MKENRAFEAFARSKLDETIDGMDGATRTRLTAIRRKAMAREAVASNPVNANQPRRGWWLPVSLATAMTALTLIWMMPQQQGNHEVDVAAMEDLDLLASDVEMDLLEDVEFYQWLNDDNHAG